MLFDPTETLNDFMTNNYDAAMVVTKSTGIDKNNVEVIDGFVKRYEKNSDDARLKYLDYGLSYFKKKKILSCNFTGSHDLSKYHNFFIKTGRLGCYQTTDVYYEIGSDRGQKNFTEFLENKNEFH